MKKTVLFWGSSGVFGDDGSGYLTRYRHALDLIEEGAHLYNADVVLIQYPGHPDKKGVRAGELNFHNALRVALEQCELIRPEWMIGRSFGATVGIAALGSGASWVRSCTGAVLWGPAFNKYLHALWPTEQDKMDMIQEYRRFNTSVADNFFQTLPDIESLVNNAESNLRFARGANDSYNSLEELKRLELIHTTAQPTFMRDVIELDGFDHTPTSSKLTRVQREEYFRCLFKPFTESGECYFC
jgi:hypothetical protein